MKPLSINNKAHTSMIKALAFANEIMRQIRMVMKEEPRALL